MTLHAPKKTRRKLEFYSDKDRTLTPVLAPRGWACKVELGEDGSGAIRIHSGANSPKGQAASLVKN